MKNTKPFISQLRPDLIEEWHTSNKDTPNNVRAGSGKNIVWCCKECKHVWRTTANLRALRNTGCPKCNERYNVGFPELAIFYYIKQVFKDGLLNAHIDGIDKFKSVDIFIPSLKLVIEYDGGHTHRNKKDIDIEKSKLIIDKGYELIRIRDNGLPPLKIEDLQEYLYERTSNKTIGKMIVHLLSMIDRKYEGFTTEIEKVKKDINVDVDNIPILAQIPAIIEKENLLEKCPKIEKVWDYGKNFPLVPENFKQYSNFKAWFICEYEHSTLAQIGSKAQGHGCNVCSGKVAMEEYNFELLFPELAKEWHYELNRNVTPDLYLPYSNERVFWNCPKCNSSYDKKINDRTGGGEGCPYCAGKRVNETNCLATTHPHLAKEWDYNKNGDLTPQQVTKGAHDKVYWVCEKGHSYPSVIYARTDGKCCPDCYELFGRYKPKKVKPENSLAIKKPEIAKQWHPTKNGDVCPDQVGAYARKEYWWLCDKGHSWEIAPNSRNSPKCKFCK
ncbi:zinc-ribbon domain-containing protein [Metabacillus litoralis]|uniref:zinc-ribbon domain-containing protein n=1 Tax=Metabacillus litoralis TaxID=152268 RepID=UPI001CFDAF35|nr:zinc-ribbon domain-containing protein [Metabacillus litoralis]